MAGINLVRICQAPILVKVLPKTLNTNGTLNNDYNDLQSNNGNSSNSNGNENFNNDDGNNVNNNDINNENRYENPHKKINRY